MRARASTHNLVAADLTVLLLIIPPAGQIPEAVLQWRMFITGLGTAVPPRAYKQSEGWDALQESSAFEQLDLRSRAILKKVLLGNNGIETRHLALNPLSEAFELNPDALHARFRRHAPALAAEAGQNALSRSGRAPEDIDAVVISTCTGYLCPGLTSYVAEQLQLRRDVLCLDLVGQGCGAAIPNLRTGEALLASGRCERVLSICVEVCSAAFFLDADPGVLVSACLFADGAAAALLESAPDPNVRRIQWTFSMSHLDPSRRDLLRFEQKHGMLRNILSLQVPRLAAESAGALLEEALLRTGHPRAAITEWIFHAGGRDVLNALQSQIGLSAEDIRHSTAILRQFGNISSPFALFALDRALADRARGGAWWMGTFGAGFSSHGALLMVE
jgi:predicted naringenin-chalcone synthase